MGHTHNDLQAIVDFRDPDKFIYNSDLVEFTEYGVQLKDRINPRIVTAATFSEYTSCNYSNLPIFNTPVMNGTVSIQNSKLAMLGGQYHKNWILKLKEDFALGEVLPQGEIWFRYYPNYSGNPSKTQFIFSLGLFPSLDKPTNVLQLAHTSTGDFIAKVFDKVGTELELKTNHLVEFANQPIEFVISFEAVANEGEDSRIKFNVFLNGQSFAKFDVSADSFIFNRIRGFCLGLCAPGTSYAPNFSIEDFVVIDKAFHIDIDQIDAKFERLPEHRFTICPQRIEPIESVAIEQLNNAKVLTNESVSKDYDFYVHYTFKIDDTEYFFDRTKLKWAKHEKPEHISDLGYMLAYKDQLIKEPCDFKIIPYLRTIRGNRTPQISNLQICYNEFIPCKEDIRKSLVYGYVRDIEGLPISNAKIIITPSKAAVTNIGNFILPLVAKTVKTGSSGYWDIALPLTTNFKEDLTYNFQVIVRDEIVFERANIRVTKEGSIKFEDLVAQSPAPIPPVFESIPTTGV